MNGPDHHLGSVVFKYREPDKNTGVQELDMVLILRIQTDTLFVLLWCHELRPHSATDITNIEEKQFLLQRTLQAKIKTRDNSWVRLHILSVSLPMRYFWSA